MPWRTPRLETKAVSPVPRMSLSCSSVQNTFSSTVSLPYLRTIPGLHWVAASSGILPDCFSLPTPEWEDFLQCFPLQGLSPSESGQGYSWSFISAISRVQINQYWFVGSTQGIRPQLIFQKMDMRSRVSEFKGGGILGTVVIDFSSLINWFRQTVPREGALCSVASIAQSRQSQRTAEHPLVPQAPWDT